MPPTVAKSKMQMRLETPAVANSVASRSNSMEDRMAADCRALAQGTCATTCIHTLTHISERAACIGKPQAHADEASSEGSGERLAVSTQSADFKLEYQIQLRSRYAMWDLVHWEVQHVP